MADLQSKAYFRLLDLVSEGEIAGLVNGEKSIYLDGVRLQNDDGTYNFQGVTWDSRTGTNAQTYIPGFAAVESEVTVNTEVKKNFPITRTISDANINAVRVTLGFPQLFSQDTKSGGLYGTSVAYQIAISTAGGPYVTMVDTSVSGKATSKYQKSHRIELTGAGPWNVRVTRLTDDSTASTVQNKSYFDAYTEIVDAKFRYPNSALVGISIDAQNFQSVPARAYDMKLLKVKIPSNYNPTTRVYTGIWDGTFTTAWTDNPAWCFYDILTNNRYGLGAFVPEANVDKWALYQVGKYCDELVDNGFGGFEPRFSCNMYLQSRAEAYKVLQDMAAVFRGMVYWANGTITVTQDAPQDAGYLYTTSNVVGGTFSYSGSSAKARHTVALVTWNDPDDLYAQKVEYVEDATGISRYGIVQTEVVAIGCTSRGQANRVGRWLLYSEQSETETVTFKAGLEGAIARPGQVIKVADQARAGSRQGGRIASATTTAVTLDKTPSTSVTGAMLSAILPDGSVEERPVQSIVDTVVTVSTAFSTAPATGSIWMLSTNAVQPQEFRVITVTEQQDGYDITALAYNGDKYDLIEDGLILQPRTISVLTLTPEAPTNIALFENLYESSAEVRTQVSISWSAVTGATTYLVKYAVDDNNFVTLPETSATTIDVLDATAGLWKVEVYAVNSIGAVSQPGYFEKTVFGKTLPPANVSSFSMIPVAGSAYLTWQKATDLDVLVGGTVRVRHSPLTAGATWNNAVDILPAMSGNQTSATAPLLTGTYLAKFVDSSGYSSPTAAAIVTTVPQVSALNVVATVTESPSFAGVRDTVWYNPAVSGLTIDSATKIDAMTTPIDSWEFIDTLGGVAAAGVYTFANSVDLGAAYPARVTAGITAVGYDTGAIIDYRLNNLDDWSDFDGNLADLANVTLYMRTTSDNPAGAPVWSDWKPFFVGEYTARAFQFQLRFATSSATQNIAVTALSVSVDMADRVEAFSGLVSGTSTYTVTFAQAFRVTPAIGITANNLASGDYYTLANQSASGFDIIFKNAAGSAVSRTFDVMAKGYGRQL